MARVVTLTFEITVADGDDADCIGDAVAMLSEAIAEACELEEIGQRDGDIVSRASVSGGD